MRSAIKTKIILLIFFSALFMFGQFARAAQGKSLAINEEWRIIKSETCTVFCHPEVKLEKVYAKIKSGLFGLNCSSFLTNKDTPQDKLTGKFNCILQTVQKILDMYPRKLHLKIRIYKDQTQLDNAFAKLLGKPNKPQLISFYIHKYATIYTTEKVIRKGIIAHEMAHAVIDHYFLILPPETIKEILAQYVEMHLTD